MIQIILFKCRIYGDFFGKKGMADLESSLIGQPLREGAIKETLTTIDLRPYFGPIDPTVLINLLLA